MNHLTDEQLDALMLGEGVDSEHLASCRQCRDQLASRLALAGRLRAALVSVHAGEDLKARLRQQFQATPGPESGLTGSARSRQLKMLRRHWRGLTAAAAVLLITLPLYLYVSSPGSLRAVQEELADIHAHNLSDHGEFFTDADPQRLAEFMRSNLGFTPSFPAMGQGMKLRGCCVAHFRHRPVGSYVVDTPRGYISVIVAPESPQDLGMTRFQGDPKGIRWTGSYARCNMATIVIGKLSYCAVGEVPHQTLMELLELLLPVDPS